MRVDELDTESSADVGTYRTVAATPYWARPPDNIDVVPDGSDVFGRVPVARSTGFTLIIPGHIDNELSIENPHTASDPWSLAAEFNRAASRMRAFAICSLATA